MESQNNNLMHPHMDFSTIPPVNQERTVAIINKFIAETVSLLNDFAKSCEATLIQFERKIQRIEASLLILESQLSSIPDIKASTESVNLPDVIDLPEIARFDLSETSEDNRPEQNKTRAIDDSRFAKYFKMVQVGVPADAVKLKMVSDGLDPTILDNPMTAIDSI